MSNETTNTEPKKPGTPSESVLRQKVVPYADEIINKLLEHMRSRNPNVSLGAANTLLKKIIPDLKALELTGENGEPIKFNILAPSTYFSAIGKLDGASTASTYGRSTTVQSADLAPSSPEDNNSNQSVSSVEST